jgi:ribosome-associated heat shock protein Hsp15
MDPGTPFQRLDKWLWCARFLRGREECAKLVAAGRLRLNRQPTDKPHAKLRVGDIVTIALGADVRVVEVLALADRRGPARAAQMLYRIIPDPAAASNAALHKLPCGEGESAAYREG